MIRSNRIPKISLGLLAVAIVYLLAISGQPRMADGGLSGHEMYLPEKLLALAVPLSVFATMVIAAIRAGRAGSWLWLISCIFVWRSEEHTSELQSLMRISYAVFCLKKK